MKSRSILQKRFYDDLYKGYTEYKLENWRISYMNRVFKLLGIGEEDVFLDVGVGGSGYTVIEAAKIGALAIGIGLSFEGMKKAHEFSKKALAERASLCHFVACSATNLPFKNKSISKLTSIAVLEHIPDDSKAIAEMHRIMKNHGAALITVPNAYELIFPIFRIACRLRDKHVGHLRTYNAEGLKNSFTDVVSPARDCFFMLIFRRLYSSSYAKCTPDLASRTQSYGGYGKAWIQECLE